jgi:hypothetical protein
MYPVELYWYLNVLGAMNGAVPNTTAPPAEPRGVKIIEEDSERGRGGIAWRRAGGD